MFNWGRVWGFHTLSRVATPLTVTHGFVTSLSGRIRGFGTGTTCIRVTEGLLVPQCQRYSKMPLLTISSTRVLDPARKEPFFEETAELYADVMDSETRFLSVRYESVPREDLWLGRADQDSDIVVLEADVREGRPPDQRRQFTVAFMEKLHEE